MKSGVGMIFPGKRLVNIRFFGFLGLVGIFSDFTEAMIEETTLGGSRYFAVASADEKVHAPVGMVASTIGKAYILRSGDKIVAAKGMLLAVARS